MGTFARTVAGGGSGTPAKFKSSGNALAENASHARAQAILATQGRGFLDARLTNDSDNACWEKFNPAGPVFLLAPNEGAR